MNQLTSSFCRPTLALLVLLGCQSLAVQPAFAGATEWIAIKVEDGRLLVETEVGGIPGYSMIDTGAQINGINSAFVKASGLKLERGRFITVIGVNGKARRDTYTEVPARVFGSQINFRDLVELNLGGPDNLQLILGASFLHGYIFQFDYPNQRLRLITRDSLDLKKIKNIKSKRDRNGGSPLVRVSLTDRDEAWLTMDTGSTGGILLDRDLANRLGWLDNYPIEKRELAGVNTSATVEHFTVPSIGFGPVKIADVAVDVPAFGEDMEYFEKVAPLGTRIPAASNSKGLLGYDILQHFVVTIDYKTGYVHIHAGEKLPDGS